MNYTRHRQPRHLVLSSLFPAEGRQAERIAERRESSPVWVRFDNQDYEVHPGVYQTSVDTCLMLQAVHASGRTKVLEVGCGCGVVSLVLARRAKSVVGVDINPLAVCNSTLNAARLGISNAQFLVSDVFEAVQGQYDVVICNPPYNRHEASDYVERMFWDPDDEMKRRFFARVCEFLRPRARVYFGWADFAELDGALPLRLAESAGLRYVRHVSAVSRNSTQAFHVIRFAMT